MLNDLASQCENELKGFLNLAASLTKKQSEDAVFYYPENALKRIKKEQFKVFLEECLIEGLIEKKEKGFDITKIGLKAVLETDKSVLIEPYNRAKKRINKLYVDVLI